MQSYEVTKWKIGLRISVAVIVLPLLYGISGTVIAMMRAYREIDAAETGMADPEALSADISHALHTTTIGIVIAVFGAIAAGVCVAMMKRAMLEAEGSAFTGFESDT